MVDWRIWTACGTALLLAACGSKDELAETAAAPGADQLIDEEPQETGPAGRLTPALISTGWPDLQTPVLPERLGMSREGITAFEEAVAAAVDERGAPGMAVILVRDGHVASYVAVGSAPEGGATAAANTVWQTETLAAPVITTGLLMLYDEGQFLLDEPAGYYLPEGRLGPDPDTGPTVGELMSGNGSDGPDLQLQAEMIEYISQTLVGVYLEERIFNPLGMTSMALAEGPGGRLVLQASLKDMARFSQMLASRGGIGGARILDAGTVREMATDRLSGDRWALNSGLGEDMTPGSVGRGLGVSVVRVPDVTGPGASIGSFFAAGEGSFLLVDSHQGLTLVGLSEGTGGRDGDADVFRAIASAAYGALDQG